MIVSAAAVVLVFALLLGCAFRCRSFAAGLFLLFGRLGLHLSLHLYRLDSGFLLGLSGFFTTAAVIGLFLFRLLAALFGLFLRGLLAGLDTLVVCSLGVLRALSAAGAAEAEPARRLSAW